MSGLEETQEPRSTPVEPVDSERLGSHLRQAQRMDVQAGGFSSAWPGHGPAPQWARTEAGLPTCLSPALAPNQSEIRNIRTQTAKDPTCRHMTFLGWRPF